MIVGLSTFDAILDTVMRESAEPPRVDPRPWAGMDGLMSSFVAARPRGEEARVADPVDPAIFGYDDIPDMPRPQTRSRPQSRFQSRPQQARPEPARPEPSRAPVDISIYKRLAPEEIARDLGLVATDTPAHLKRKRRAFARVNHPDSSPAEWREAATKRMQIANKLVDEALKKAEVSAAAAARATGARR